MKNILYVLIAATCFTLSISATASERKVCIDKNWKFHYGAIRQSINPGFDDSGWRTLDLPHDWSVETDAATAAGNAVGPFSKSSVGGSATGQTVGGEGWYRKVLEINPSDEGKRISLYFEGAYNQTDVWLNGIRIYFNHYGYSSFRFDITDYCQFGQDNVLTVRVANEGRNSRWYAGSGIYRHVWIIKTDAVHLDRFETAITTENLTGNEAKIKISTLVCNETDKMHATRTHVSILGPDGAEVASSASNSTNVDAQNDAATSFTVAVPSPHVWSTETPTLYKAVITTGDDAMNADTLNIPFGIRTISVSAANGLLVNGKSVLLKGGCVHHDQGLLGACSYDFAERRKVSLLKQYGYNAVRCAHNLPSECFLDECDRQGLMVIDETFDQWEKQKNSDDYHRFFDAYSGRDVQIMVKRDRNHPSIMFWSIGNEIQERADASGVAIAKELRRNILVYDSTRLITAAVNDFWDNGNYSWDKDSYRAFQYLDVGGYNYMYGKYVSDHAAYPQRVMMGTESYPKLASQNWDLVEAKSYVIGDFVWTAMDYLGEAGIGHVSVLGAGESNPFFMGWPWYNGWCGDIDIIGQKKPQSYYRDVVWRNSPITMAVEAPVAAGKHTAISGWGWQDEYQSWTFPEASEGTNLAVNVYSRSSKVRLYLNGVLLGEKAPSSTYWAGFSVPYKKGTLKAVQYDGKTEGASFELKTTGTPVGIRLVTDSTELSANGTDLAYVTAELIDEEGNVVRNDSIHVAFSCSGEGALIASGNGAPNDMESFRSTNPRLFHGRAMAILRTTNVAGDVTLKAEATGFESQTIRIKTTKQKDNATSVRSGKLSADDIKIYAHDHHIYVIGAAHYSVFNTMGVAVDSKGALASGVYVVKANNQAKKVALIF